VAQYESVTHMAQHNNNCMQISERSNTVTQVAQYDSVTQLAQHNNNYAVQLAQHNNKIPFQRFLKLLNVCRNKTGWKICFTLL